MWNAQVELDIRLTARNTEALAEQWLEALADYHPVISTSQLGRASIVISLPAESLRQACTTALAVVHDATGRKPVAVEAMVTEDFDKREVTPEIPPVYSVTEAAEVLGITRQSLLQAITEGRIPAAKAGNAYILAQSVIDTRAQAAAGAAED